MNPLRTALDAAAAGACITDALVDTGTALSSPTLIEAMYEAQAGSYTAEAHDETLRAYTAEVSRVFADTVGQYDDVLDVGTGEANRLIAALRFAQHRGRVAAVDISWSRLSWAHANAIAAGLTIDFAVADTHRLPLGDGAVDWVTSIHALEPNAGREVSLLVEMARVARRGLLLIEPDWDIASERQRGRMYRLGFIGSVRTAAKRAGLTVRATYPLENNANPDNAASVFVIDVPQHYASPLTWFDPVDGDTLLPFGGGLRTAGGLFYPVLAGIPFLRQRDALMAARPAPGMS